MVEAIKFDIIFGRLRPRERLIEDELSNRFGASRHVIRSAFVELERIGLVTRRPNKGAVVRDFSVREVEEIYDMRAILQAEAARRIPLPPRREFIDQVDAIHNRYCNAVDKRDLKEVCTLNNEFHRVIFAECNSTYLANIIDRMWTETLAIRCYAIGDPVLLQLSRKEHQKIVQALKSSDRDTLVRVSVEHIYHPLDAYKRAHGGWLASGSIETIRRLSEVPAS